MALPASGSARKNFSASHSGEKYIITYNENLDENSAFIYFSEVFSRLQLNTPKIIAVAGDRRCYIQENVGSRTLSEVIAEEGISPNVTFLVMQALQKLFYLQQKTKNLVDFSQTFEYPRYNEIPVLNDLFYFKSFCADVLEIPYSKSRLISEFKQIAAQVEKLELTGLMLRDFQSRNIMVNDSGEVFFIDYQSAMEGPLMYDVVSFLYQAKANFTENFRQEMLGYYYSLFSREDAAKLQKALPIIKLLRFAQVLGAYGFRGLVQKKPHFVASIHQGIFNLAGLFADRDTALILPEFSCLAQKLASPEAVEKINNFITP